MADYAELIERLDLCSPNNAVELCGEAVIAIQSLQQRVKELELESETTILNLQNKLKSARWESFDNFCAYEHEANKNRKLETKLRAADAQTAQYRSMLERWLPFGRADAGGDIARYITADTESLLFSVPKADSSNIGEPK